MNPENFIGPTLPAEEREKRALARILPELKEMTSRSTFLRLNPKNIEDLAERLEKDAKINALDSDVGSALLLLAGWLRGPDDDEKAEMSLAAFENLKRLVEAL